MAAPTPLRPEDITEISYTRYAARYGATNVIPPPPLVAYIGLALAPTEGLGEGKAVSIASKDFLVPTGYILSSYSLAASIVWVNFPQFNVQVRGDIWEIQNSNAGGGAKIVQKQIGDVVGNNAHVAGVVPVSVTCYDIASFSLNLQGVCLRTPEALAVWQLSTFNQIQTAYQGMQSAYDQKVTQAIGGQHTAARPESQRQPNRREHRTEEALHHHDDRSAFPAVRFSGR